MTLSHRRQFLSSSLHAGLALASSAGLNGLISQLAYASERDEIAPASIDMHKIRAAAQQAIETPATPGLAICIWQAGLERFSYYAGVANLEQEVAVQADSVFRIGSLSKQFTAAMILKLVEAKALSLDDPAKKFLPILRNKPSFTVRELLQHTAGIHDQDIDPRLLHVGSQTELVKLVAKQKKLFDFPSGSAWLYSNSNYFIAGAIIEQVTTKSLAEAGKDLLFTPLDLRNTGFEVPSQVIQHRVAGYSQNDKATGTELNAFLNAEYEDMKLNGAAGGMISTASDLCRWHQALFTGKILSKSSLQSMLSPGLLRNKNKASTHRFSPQDKVMGNANYGLGLWIDEESTIDASAIVHHHGGVMGFASMLVSHPQSGLTYAVLCNTDSHPGLPFRDVRRAALASVLKR
ncbi:serine hydrolase domain-containing protein [Undibacterium cyanobacteriorum]|uniref:Serine hydrolase domain-containing protein n=1 Tax=Undibacterium cyanobacteriorum TaxID=3073561 RepID=A0ABY9RHR9_9BURK|nr:serine hydrolase domain-containing protein [Undibacterium sp. 20NA77.5]WMW80774.1 serine hydrolase domain-containing protein [Undibacterium sp. 20NA77.5]